MKIAVVGALPHELNALVKHLNPQRQLRIGSFPVTQGTYFTHDIVVALTGIGTRSAKAALESVLNAFDPDLILSIGFAGALYEDAAVCDLVAATSVFLVSGEFLKSIRMPDESGLLGRLHNGTSPRLRAGSFFTLERLVEKKEVRQLVPTDAAFPVCEMETFPLAELALGRQIRFLAVRSITDRLDEEIPPEFLEVTDRAGHCRALKAASLFLRKPQLIPMAAKLATRSRKASEALWRAFDALVRAL
jgi:adenosylhomocysteine nucleosidase